MILALLQVIFTLALFFMIKWMCHLITEEWGLPQWLNYMPYVCRKCLTFWTLLSTYLVCGLILNLWVMMGVGIAITILDTIAVIVDEKNKTIYLDI